MADAVDKVYLVTSGSYSDYGVNAVFLDKAEAEQYAAELNKCAGHDDADVDEWDVGRPQDGKVLRQCWEARIDAKTGAMPANEEFAPNFPGWMMASPNAKVDREYDVAHEARCFMNPLSRSWGLPLQPCIVRRVSFVSQEHANKLAIEARQEILRVAAQRQTEAVNG